MCPGEATCSKNLEQKLGAIECESEIADVQEKI
jgi:hypothetical protein